LDIPTPSTSLHRDNGPRLPKPPIPVARATAKRGRVRAWIAPVAEREAPGLRFAES
jgi:hypothetical protein